ncbi:hypothetical protein HVTV-2_gp135 [Haloarcula virus HVTV-2]|uniref:CARDB domain-containing protein n=1 Tax=Haloarcula vallismortis tailed virus 1 TaxID=1262528 RepID=L7TJE2_9CAUD|nr:hypothetical protein HVTV1_134 [Haloarcula vallismortis tailed virus 1]AGC34503.1 hypothetical protein HVTV1_134 [Haloarcula vallismortis tailed virus 1]UBF22942.1 hypothetical protein HVTV-2_gp135 [Haloarcula virus HVTV-2]
MSELTEEKKLIWLGLKRPQSDTSVVHEELTKLQNNVGDFSTFQNDLDAYDLDGDGNDEDISNYTQFKTYLTDNGFSSTEADTFINRIQNNFTDEDSSGSTYDEFESYVENQASTFTELKNAFNSNTTIGTEQETDTGEQTAGIKFFENDGYTKDGVFAPAGSTEIFGNEIHLSQTGAPSADSADISYSNLAISNTTPVRYEEIDISADITNNGSRRGSVFAPLIEDGSVVSRKRVEIAAGATETVTFKRQYTEYESIEVTIKNLPTQTVVVIPEGLAIL